MQFFESRYITEWYIRYNFDILRKYSKTTFYLITKKCIVFFGDNNANTYFNKLKRKRKNNVFTNLKLNIDEKHSRNRMPSTYNAQLCTGCCRYFII